MAEDVERVQQGYEPVEYVKKGYQPTGQNPPKVPPANVGSAAVKPSTNQSNADDGQQN